MKKSFVPNKCDAIDLRNCWDKYCIVFFRIIHLEFIDGRCKRFIVFSQLKYLPYEYHLDIIDWRCKKFNVFSQLKCLPYEYHLKFNDGRCKRLNVFSPLKYLLCEGSVPTKDMTLGCGHIYIKNAHSAESNEKLFFGYCWFFFYLWLIVFTIYGDKPGVPPTKKKVVQK